MAVALRVKDAASGDDEQALVAAVRRGDDRAFELLYARYRTRIGAFISGMVADHGRAEDIAQEVFISALRRLRATDRPVLFKPWLYEIAKNACIDEYRRAHRAREIPLHAEDGHDDVINLRSPSPSPDAAIESKQQLDHLRGAFRGLSESHHRILVLRELEGLTYHQIGVRMGISKPVVESTLFRARRRLGEEYAEIESGRRCARVRDMIAAADERPVKSLGLRDRRLLTRHLSDCASCRRLAHVTGLEAAEPVSSGNAKRSGRIAAAAASPLPLLRLRRSLGSSLGAPRGGHVFRASRALESLAPLTGSTSSLSGSAARPPAPRASPASAAGS